MLHFGTHEPVTRGHDGTQPQMCFTRSRQQELLCQGRFAWQKNVRSAR